jgi:hypothetical protein
MKPDRKPRVQSRIEKLLPKDQQEEIWLWMQAGETYGQIRARAKKSFGVTLSDGSLSSYYAKRSKQALSSPGRSARSDAVEHVRVVLHIEIRPELQMADH